jgi:nicotinate-nucleotide adenylyltransferase
MARVGLYFGSFNPVHIGHIAIAGYMTEFAGLDQVWLVVSPHNPLKKKETLLADHHRLYMTQLAIGDNDKLKASDIEFRMPVPSYTIDTITYIEEKYPTHSFCLVMGEDNLFTLHKWKNADELIKKCPIYIYPRRSLIQTPPPVLEMLLNEAEIHRTDAPEMQISGTFIRKGISEGKNMSYFLSPGVWKYITEMHLYEK